ncbi:MAG: stage V sporulation protein AA [Lachnospiraceae bacterium]|nr:stage V sporulation protein AA [Lachnospiraceae bacterium]
MQKKTIYLDVEKHVCVAADKVYMKDVAGLYCKDNDILAKAKILPVASFSKDSKRLVISALSLAEKLETLGSEISVEIIGETDVIAERKPEKEPSATWTSLKVMFVVLICFFGTSFTIMAFHNDIGIRQLFDEIYRLVKGEENPGFGPLEIAYSVGLAVGIIVFFNHIGKKRLGRQLTPIEVEMKVYEEEIDKALVEMEKRRL